MQLGTVRGILQRNKNKACRGSLIPNVPVLTAEETFARGNTVGQGLKEPSLLHRVARLVRVCVLKGKLFSLMPDAIVVL